MIDIRDSMAQKKKRKRKNKEEEKKNTVFFDRNPTQFA